MKPGVESSVRIAAIVINYRTPDLTLAAVQSVLSELDPRHDAMYVVDNCSGDDSYAKLQAALPGMSWPGRIELLASARNGGFSYGNNVAMQRVRAEGYLLLNSDAELKPGALKDMWQVLRDDPRCGLVGPLVCGEDGVAQVSCFVDRSPLNEFLISAKTGLISKAFGQFGVHEIALSPGGAGRAVDWVSFVCVLIRGSVVAEIGLMDEGYFMYREDNDYCRRARMKGWTVYYAPLARAMHLNTGWSGKESARQPAFYYQSRARYFVKFYGWSGLLAANVLWLFGRLLHLARELLAGTPSSVPAMAWLDIWTFDLGSKPVRRPVDGSA